MRKLKALDKQPYVAPDGTPTPVPVPTGGWDAISPLAAMDPKNAVTLQNWVPRPGWIELRPGYTAWSQNLNSSEPVETLMTYRSPLGEQLFAISGGNVYNVTDEGSAIPVWTGLASSRWQYVNFSPQGTGVHYLLAVDGQDHPLLYNGTTWTNPVITGVNPNLFSNVAVYQYRLWFAMNSTTQFAYLSANAIQGAANIQDFGGLWDQGGFAVAMGTWTIDGGTGPNSYAAFLSSRGQMTLYLGTDPTTVNTWNLVGTFRLPPPLGTRCMTTVGSDLAIITLQGVIPISQALPFDPSAVRSVAITSQIQNAMASAATSYQTNFGWELITYPAQTLVFLNVPTATNAAQQQFVMNALTGAWCNFTGWNANTFAIFEDQLYFGDNNSNVNLAYTGSADLVSPIFGVMECAFNYFNMPERIKRITMVQPMMVTSGTITPTIQINVDFASTAPSAPVSTLTGLGAVWDSAIWDVSLWSGGTGILTSWLSAEGLGRAMSIQLTVNVGPTGVGSSSVFDTGTFDTMVFDGFGTSTQTLQIDAFNVMLEGGGQV
jgi:hypothetical protein